MIPKKSLSLKDKGEIIRAHETGERKRTIANRIGRHHSVVQRVINDKEKIKAALEDGKNAKLKRLKQPRYIDVDASMIGWLKYMRSENVPATGDLMKVLF
jgi:IS30 family transposase